MIRGTSIDFVIMDELGWQPVHELRLDNWRPTAPLAPGDGSALSQQSALGQARAVLRREIARVAPTCQGCPSNFIQGDFKQSQMHTISARCSAQTMYHEFPSTCCPFRSPDTRHAGPAADADVPQTQPNFSGFI
jgi:hypothetical protein